MVNIKSVTDGNGTYGKGDGKTSVQVKIDRLFASKL